MNTLTEPELKLDVAVCWPVTGPDWSNLSHKHRVQADGANWDAITPNGSTRNKAPKSPKPDVVAALERRAVLRNTGPGSEIMDLGGVIGKFVRAKETLEELKFEELALATSGLADRAKEKRQEVVIQRVAQLNEAFSEETETIGVLMMGGGKRFMARLGGFFVPSPVAEDAHDYFWDNVDSVDPEPGIIVFGSAGEQGQVPEEYEASGLYLRA